MSSSFYARGGDGVFLPSDYTIGPWSREAQHGGPPAALLGRALEKEAGPEKQIVRITYDILKPVPLTPLEVQSKVVRPGKKVALIESSMQSDGVTVMRAAGWAIRTAELDLPASGAEEEPPEGPDGYAGMGPWEPDPRTNYLRATEWRFVAGGFFDPG
ncbi:MAG: hypothetical protein QOH26_1438, partial [Actinomycetota bacterium]|nr:hypothetical protein [Actinomycetota bacterium]